ncbi:hypothetical protein [Undibacterium curvum]|uniref:hypothetical protein n=1 Tax=Undibacterium curvum TaxID=2762294 RepID=UPI003D0F258A
MSNLCALLLPPSHSLSTMPDSSQQSNPISFPLGKIVATEKALASLKNNHVLILDLLCRHQSGDWGIVHEEDRAGNNEAVRHGGAIISSYEIEPNRQIVWIITEANRSVTTLLLPDDY